MKYIVDTHSLIWYFAKDKRLTNKIKNLLQEAEQGKNEIIIPVIVLLEAVDIQEKKKVRFKIERLLEFIEEKGNFKIIDLNFSLIKEIIKIGKGLDLHDRIIVTISKIYKGIILTKDSKIKKFAKIIW